MDVRLAEYKALRDESLRCSQLLSNTMWVAVTGYAVTIGIAASFVGRNRVDGWQVLPNLLVPAVAALLCIQSLIISIIYLSELWKYIRVGYYIRTQIEEFFKKADPRLQDCPPMGWEYWVQSHRARALYIWSLMFLQLPVIFTVVGPIIGRLFAGRADEGVGQFLRWLTSDKIITSVLILLVALDVVFVKSGIRRVNRAKNGEFGD